ncbi:carcinoembryonic antigen-related cell adhesion molecule 1-like [Fundulus heteroclitus]|uniref:carcinoembryonic antigen-related cell adhesion molecule 1-like n=1 Tax=Fundulus heteroclitus TaxID=8078 RepID=UPI00165B2E96|nr:carcinoembryonic antigen-related cell adhesion molecule 1-like [Fundulus heteroclitus]
MFCLSLLFLLSLTGCCVGNDILPEGPLYVGLGEDLVVNILYKKAPGDIVVWNFNDDNNIATLRANLTVNQAYKGRASVDTTNGFLTVKALTLKDSGDYSLTILTDTGTLAGGVTVQVLAPVSNVVINAEPAEVIEYNDTVALNCTAKGSGLTFTWTNNSNNIVSDGKRVTVTHSLTQESSSSKLTISGVLRYDLVGPIVCKAQNKLGQASSVPFNRTVYYGPEDVILKPSAPSEYVPSKSNFTLTCSASSNPSATFTWFHNEKQITGTDPVLTLKAIEEQGYGKTAGNYKCVAQNAKTKRAVSSAPIKFSVMEPISGIKITGPSGTLLADNSSASLSCQAEAGNVTSIVWLKDGKTLSNTSHVIFSSDSSSISITTLKKEDNGMYKCQLSNSVSQLQAQYSMVVNYGPDSAEVKAVSQVEVDKPVTVTCAVLSVPPANITWMLNGSVIPGQAKKDLVIEKATYKDSGSYTCEAKNSITGKTITSSPVVVTVKEEIDEGLSDGAIAGIVIACLVAVGVAIALFFYCRAKVPCRSKSAHSYDVENSVSSPY